MSEEHVSTEQPDALAEKPREWLADDMGFVSPPLSATDKQKLAILTRVVAYAGPACDYCGEKDHGAHFSCGCPNRGKLCACGAL